MVRNVDGKTIGFCRSHLQSGWAKWLEDKGFGNIALYAPGLLMSAGAIIASASSKSKSAAYSKIFREKVKAILDGTAATYENASPERKELERKQASDVRFMADIMDAVDADDTVAGLNEGIKILLGHLALVQIMRLEGRLEIGDAISATTVLVAELRKTVATKFAILGSSSDELDRAVDQAISEFGLQSGGASNGKAGSDLHRSGAEVDWEDGAGSDYEGGLDQPDDSLPDRPERVSHDAA